MSTSFNTIPSNLRTPGFYVEFDNSAAGIPSTQHRALLIGDRTAGQGTAADGTIQAVGTADSAASLFGSGSELHEMAKNFFINNNNTALYAVAGGPTEAITAMGDERFHYVITARNSSAELGELTDEMHSRYGGMRQNAGIVITAKKANYSGLGTFGSALNSHLLTVLGYNTATTNEAAAAAIYGGRVAESLTDDAARPLQTLDLNGFEGFVAGFSQAERNNLLYDGISTHTLSIAGEVRIERAITTYQTNASGIADASYLDVTTPATLIAIRDHQRTKLSTAYPRHKLARNGTVFLPGQAIVTPNVIRSELVSIYEQLINRGLVEDVETYKKTLIVSIPETNPNRVDVVDDPNLMNQFMLLAMKSKFRLN